MDFGCCANMEGFRKSSHNFPVKYIGSCTVVLCVCSLWCVHTYASLWCVHTYACVYVCVVAMGQYSIISLKGNALEPSAIQYGWSVYIAKILFIDGINPYWYG